MNPGKFISLLRHIGKRNCITHLALLEAAESGGKLTDLATELGVSTAAVTSAADKLEKEKLVERVRSSTDRRKQTLSLTEKGSRYLRLALDAVECPRPSKAKLVATANL